MISVGYEKNGENMSMIEQAFELVEGSLDHTKKEMIRDAKGIKYQLERMIYDLEKNAEYRNNVPDQAVLRLAKQYAAYAEKKEAYKLIKGAHEKMR